MSVDKNFSKQDCLEGAKIRKSLLESFQNEPIVNDARATLVAAERSAPPLGYDTSSNVAARSSSALSDLKSMLGGVRSNRSSSFNESVPPSGEEARVRANIQVDDVNGVGSAAKTAVTVNIRPNNMESFKAQIDAGLGDLPYKDENDEKVDVLFTFTIAQRAGSTDEDFNAFKNTVTTLMNEGNAEKTKCDQLSITRNANGDYQIVVALRDADRDPLEEVITDFLSDQFDVSKYDDENEAMLRDGASVFRLLTLRAELPVGLAEWAEQGTQSWTRLVEGARIGVEAVLRRGVLQAGFAKAAKAGLERYELEEVRGLAAILGLFSIARDASVNVKMAPPELLYGAAIRDGGYVERRTREASDVPSHVNRAVRLEDRTDGSQARMRRDYCDYFAKAGPEALVASTIGSVLVMGVTGKKLKQRVISELATVSLEAAGDDEESKALETVFLKAIKLGGAVKSVGVVSHTFNLQATFEGIDSRITSFLPTDPQASLNAAKPIALACQSDSDVDLETSDQYVGQELDSSSLRPRKYWPRGYFQKQAEAVAEKQLFANDIPMSDGFGAVLVAPQPRTGAFRVLVLNNPAGPNSNGWQGVLTAWGANLVSKESLAGAAGAAAGGDDDDKDSGADSDEDDAAPLPDLDKGLYRCAYVKQPDGRVVELVRPVVDCDYVLGFLATCDAAVVVDSLRGDVGEADAIRDCGAVFADVSIPVLFVTTDGSAASPETTGKIPTELFTPKATRYESFSQGNAAGLLDWLIQNSNGSNKGLGEGVNSALEHQIIDNLTVA